jgi:predicted DNA-binding helix-hairpin-helix protein
VDWLIRKYGFKDDEIPFQTNGNLSLTADPKKIWADSHPERFPININRADKFELLRVPGLGPTAVARILEARRGGGRIHSLESLSLPARYLNTAQPYIKIA